MSLWEDFLDDVFGHPNKPGTVMICFVNRYLEGMDGIKYKIKYDSHEKSGVTSAENYCIELIPTSFNPIQTFVWSRQAKAYKKLDDVVAEPRRKKLVRKMLKTFKVPGRTDKLPNTQPNRRPDKPAPALPHGPSPTDPQGIKPDQTNNENGQPQAKPKRPVPEEITVGKLRKIFPKNHKGNSTDQHLQEVVDELNTDLPKYKLDTPVRQAHFFGQVKQEAGALLSGAAESLNYDAKGLKATFGSYYKNHPNEALQDGRSPTRKANQEAIANKVYGPPDSKHLGNTEPGDGWRFRGRGMKQITGRDNYDAFRTNHKELWGMSVDFVASPDKVSEMPYAVRSAVVF
ncbi:hypothetical protein CAP31_01395 [Sulfuriferula sp. AH1]|uniref:glycoside hydrolase family 19 protein n=1 Tax=Sulfuriferula sp. AH1 TaxID=1985873 RepID=UPI000B3B29A1|nr:hypothetical protein [Sulfuriferula sp. AH1]ARU30463.1 hypothetical protein CAP31_01395 [Sulfuriferula sp. AH1]